MKKLYALIIAFIIFTGAKAQNIPNPDFESWSVFGAPSNPSGYQSTNFVSFATFFSFGDSTSYRTSDHYSGKYALQLVTRANAVDTVPGTVFTGTLGGTLSNVKLLGGLPFTGKPDSIGGYFKSDMHNGDSGYIIILFKKNGFPVALDSISLNGNAKTYTHFQMALQPFFTSPDSIFIVITSGLPHHTSGNDTLTVDSLYFTNSTSPFPNGDFENWITVGLDAPDGWNTPNLATIYVGGPSVSRSADAFSGKFAMQIQTVLSDDNKTKLGYATLGAVNADTSFSGGFAYDSIPYHLVGYYKYTPVGPDTAEAVVVFRKGGKVTGYFPYKLPPESVYTQFLVPISLSSKPDSANIVFISGNFLKKGGYVGLGSTLLVDDISFVTKPTQLIASPDTLNFKNVVENTTSPDMNFTLSGQELFPDSGSVFIKAPAGFEVSLTSGSGFVQSLKLSYTQRALAITTIYVHFKPDSLKPYLGYITITGGSASKIIFAYGNSIAAGPLKRSVISLNHINDSSIGVQLSGVAARKGC